MSIDMAVIASERSSPSSSKKQSSVAVSLPSWPQTNRPVAWFETRVILWNLVCQVSAVRTRGPELDVGHDGDRGRDAEFSWRGTLRAGNMGELAHERVESRLTVLDGRPLVVGERDGDEHALEVLLFLK